MGPKNILLTALIVHLVGELLAADIVEVDPLRGFLLESPNYPKYPGARKEKSWNLIGPAGSRLLINCSVSLLKRAGCTEGFLAFWEDAGGDRVNLCSVTPFYQRESQGNQMNVQFRTELLGVGRFFCVARVKQNDDKNSRSAEDLAVGMPDYWKQNQVVGTDAKPTTCPCGWTNKMRIVGGQETGVNEYAFMAYIQPTVRDKKFCGGSIITERHVLSSASCLSDVQREKLQVVVGGHNISKDSNNTEARALPVAELILHEDFIPGQGTKDISLLYLSEDIQFNKFVGPVCLPTESNFHQKWVTALGWGRLNKDGAQSATLQYVELQSINLMSCVNAHMNIPISTSKPTQLCTFAPSKGTCLGDAGGPLVYVDPELNRFVQVGLITSESVECPSEKPSVHTLIFPFFDWIQRKIEHTNDRKEGWMYPLGRNKDIFPPYQTCDKVDHPL